MTKQASDGESYAICNQNIDDIQLGEDNEYWGFWCYKETVGEDVTDRNYRDYKELNVIKPSSNIVFNKKTSFLSGATLVHTYSGDDVSNYVMYEWKENKIQKYSSVPEDISKVEIKNSTSSKTIEIKPIANMCRYGTIFSKQIFEGGEAVSIIKPTIQLNCGFETIYSQQDELIDIVFAFGDIQFTVITKSTAKNTNYRLVLCAKENDDIISHSLYTDNKATLKVTWSDIKKINKFEFILVENYKEQNDGMSEPPKEEKVNVTVQMTAIVADGVCDKIKFNVSGLTDKSLSVKLTYDGVAYYNGYLTIGETIEQLNETIENYDNSKLTYVVTYGSEYYNVTFNKTEL
jgi:hypothetical protein